MHEIVRSLLQVILSSTHRCRAVNFNKISCPDAHVCTFTLVRSLIPFYPTKTSEPLKTGAQGNWEQTKCLHCSNMSKLSRSTKHKSALTQQAHGLTHSRSGCVSIRTSCLQLPWRPSRCVRARPLKVNGRMTLWCSEEGKVLHFTAFEFDFICWQVWPASFRGGCCTSIEPFGLFFFFYNAIYAVSLYLYEGVVTLPGLFSLSGNRKKHFIQRFCCMITSLLASLLLAHYLVFHQPYPE